MVCEVDYMCQVALICEFVPTNVHCINVKFSVFL